MKNILLVLTLLFSSVTTQAAILGAPFLPETDARFNTLEVQAAPSNYSLTGLHNKQVAVATYNFATQGGSSTLNSGGGAGVINLGVDLPAKALITRSYFWIPTTVVSAGGGTLAFQCQTAGNILAATAASTFTGTTALEGVSTGASTLFKNITSSCHVSAVIGTSDLSAGKVTAYIEYVLHP